MLLGSHTCAFVSSKKSFVLTSPSSFGCGVLKNPPGMAPLSDTYGHALMCVFLFPWRFRWEPQFCVLVKGAPVSTCRTSLFSVGNTEGIAVGVLFSPHSYVTSFTSLLSSCDLGDAGERALKVRQGSPGSLRATPAPFDLLCFCQNQRARQTRGRPAVTSLSYCGVGLIYLYSQSVVKKYLPFRNELFKNGISELKTNPFPNHYSSQAFM